MAADQQAGQPLQIYGRIVGQGQLHNPCNPQSVSRPSLCIAVSVFQDRAVLCNSDRASDNNDQRTRKQDIWAVTDGSLGLA